MLGQFVRRGLRRIVGSPIGGQDDPGSEEHPGGHPPVADTSAKSEDRRAAGDLGFWELLTEDFVTHDRDLLEPGFWAVVMHRFGTRTASIESRPVRSICARTYRTLFTVVDWGLGIHLPSTVQLGRRVRLWHSGCMLLL